MLLEEIKNQEILKNLISLSNVLQQEIDIVLENVPLNSLEISILTYISRHDITQYKIAKEFNMSIQRVNQITAKLEKFGFITKKEAIQNGRVIKKMELTPIAMQNLKFMTESIFNNLKSKGVKIDTVLALNALVKEVLEDITKKNNK